MAIDFATIEAALEAWLADATGLQSSRIILWPEKTPSLQTGPYLSLKIKGPRAVGGNRDEVQYNTDLAQPLGQEIQQKVIGHRELVASVQAFSVHDSGAGTAKELLASALIALAKPSRREAFNAAGFSFVYADQIADLALLPPDGEGRAALDVHLYVFDSVLDPVGYIAIANTSGTYST